MSLQEVVTVKFHQKITGSQHTDHTEIENEFFSKSWLAMNEKVVYKKNIRLY